jgi:hypothetical protein
MNPKLITHEQVFWSEPLPKERNKIHRQVTYRVPDEKFNVYNIFKVGHNLIEDGDYFCEDGWVYKLVSTDSYFGPKICQWGVRFNVGHGDQINIKYSRFADPNQFEKYIRKLAHRKKRRILKINDWVNSKIFLAMPFYATKGKCNSFVAFEDSHSPEKWLNKGKCKKSFSWRWISDDTEGRKTIETIKQDFNYKLDQELSDLYFKCDRYKMSGWSLLSKLKCIFDYFIHTILECKHHDSRLYVNSVMKVIFNGKEYIYVSNDTKERSLVDFFSKPIVYDFRTKKKGVKNGN